jgi:hypothetical protein
VVRLAKHHTHSGLQIQQTDSTGTGDVRVPATLTNSGKVAGAGVAQLYLNDPAAAGEPPKLADFQKLTLRPGQSRTNHLTVTPQDTWWWDSAAGGWTQSPGDLRRIRRRFLGDSAPLAKFEVTPPSYVALTTVPVRVTADLGADAQRQAGVGATVVASAS